MTRDEILLMISGLFLGFAIATFIITPAPECHEDEAAFWPMEDGEYTLYENTECIPLDDIDWNR